ncbi:unnamed protein product [Adineta steineri]|uniref:Uncharacterized protein n=2 Tax=Adineta steineri TaxID=433720 RepID=A0A818H315_9BILA|nr:unnamed protein product [Adineta steineri]CAF0721097.1 unnamed protein product [Adineta steineri]CAF3479639.1 unnamed protein product [Adineta steineri]CAF3501479.1 unnamed protein product [Adineta steineri]
MGNQHNRQKTSVKTPTTSTIKQIQHSSDQYQIIDLDEIVEQWIWYMWNRTKTKSVSHYKREELLITINWNHVTFTQSDVRFYGSPPVCIPKSQILFRTNFTNTTTTEQLYSFKTERSTRSMFKFIFTHMLTKSTKSPIIFCLPDEIVQLGGGAKSDQSVEIGQDTIKEYNMRWNVNSQIRVAPHTCTYAELNIDEEEFHGDFSVFIEFSGRITATIATRQTPDNYIRFIDGNIIEIIRETMENNHHQLHDIEIIENDPPIVRFHMRGKCSFRYGVQQHVVLKQESLNTDIDLHIADN